MYLVKAQGTSQDLAACEDTKLGSLPFIGQSPVIRPPKLLSSGDDDVSPAHDRDKRRAISQIQQEVLSRIGN